MNAAIERNAFLESELDEKESLKAVVQRMKDETRDLKSELRVLAPRHPNLSSLDSSSLDIPDNDKRIGENNNSRRDDADSNKFAADRESKHFMETPPPSAKSSPVIPNGNLTPSARLSALNIVGDLLRKVGALELKLVSCRNIVKENTAATASSSSARSSPTTTTRGISGSGAGTASSGTTPTSTEANGFMDRSKRIPRGASTPAIKKIIES